MKQEYVAMIAVAAVVLSALAVAYVVLDDDEPEGTYKYTLYVGMMRTDGTEIDGQDYEDAKDVIRQIILDRDSGYTEIEGHGGYLADGTEIENGTLIYIMVFIDEDTVRGIIDEIKSTLDLQAILCEKHLVTAEML